MQYKFRGKPPNAFVSYFCCMQIKLSVVIITFNEEKNIGRCLDSVKGIADEVIVLDSFSTDRTQEICLSKGATFFQHAFDGHIEQKNRAITYATSPYILSLDADEALDETLKQSILEVKNNWTVDGYSMNRLTNYCGQWIRHCGWYPDVKLRLWDSRKGSWGGVNPHDCYEMNHKSAPVKHLKGDILHYSYYSIEGHRKQSQYFADIAAKAMLQKGKRANAGNLLINPPFRFFRDYILKLGFLDGYYGFVICKITMQGTYRKYHQLMQLQKSL
jgi:glycosyltransferase involved in cell wall biosynthesis